MFAGSKYKEFEINEDSSYIVCFCAEDDKLSQWRGYAHDGGVSIGFDFKGTVPFYALSASYDGNTDNKTVNQFVHCYPVKYLKPDMDIKLIAGIFGIEENGDEDNSVYYENSKNATNRVFPYIKHDGFKEEDEWRLVFSNTNKSSLRECVRFRANKEVMMPYIIVKTGNPSYEKKNCVIRVADLNDTDIETLKHRLKNDGLNNLIHNCTDKKKLKNPDSVCFGCTRRVWYKLFQQLEECRYELPGKREMKYYIYERDKNEIIISQGKNQKKYLKLCINGQLNRMREDKKNKGMV